MVTQQRQLFVRLFIVLAVSSSFLATNALRQQEPDPVAIETFLDEFKPKFDEINTDPRFDGFFGAMYVAVSHPLIGDHYFFGKEAEISGSIEDHWGNGSLSKTFMATLIIQFVEQGLLSMDQTVPEVLPELDTSQAYGNVTLYQLLTMTSGVPDFLNDPEGLLSETFTNPDQNFTVQDIVDGAVASAPVQPPGTPGYSSTNYVILQAIAERIGGKPANELYNEHLYGPLGMSLNGTVLPPRNGNEPVPPPRSRAINTPQCDAEFNAYGFNTSENGVAIGGDITDTLSPLVDLAGASGSMWSVLEDMLIWSKSGTGNSLLSSDSVADRLDNRYVSGREYGMGIHNCPTSNDFETGYWGHAGEAFGYESLSCHNLDTKGSFFVATTSCGMESSVNIPVFTAYLSALEKAIESTVQSTAPTTAPMNEMSSTPTAAPGVTSSPAPTSKMDPDDSAAVSTFFSFDMPRDQGSIVSCALVLLVGWYTFLL